MTGSFLALDLGNTHLTIGLYRDDRKAGSWRLSTDPRRTADEWWVLLTGLLAEAGKVERVALSSVVPDATAALADAVERAVGRPVELVDHRTPGILVDVADPASVGADRLLNAVSVHRAGLAPAIIVDFGTATNIDVVNATGAYVGGAIAPGVGVSTAALLAKASRLPGFPLAMPTSAIGRTTIACLQVGTVFGFAGLVDAIVERIQVEMGSPSRVIATGGYAQLIAGASRTIQTVDEDLTVDGLYRLFGKLATPGA